MDTAPARLIAASAIFKFDCAPPMHTLRRSLPEVAGVPRGKPTAIDIHVGKRLREARKTAGVRTAELAARLGVTSQKLQNYEEGIDRIGADFLIKSAIALHIGVSYFYDGLQNIGADGKMESGRTEKLASIMKFVATEEGMQLNLAFSGICDPKLRKQALEIIQHLSTQSTSH
jgi:transcriptional regulator with XRE-family HTH domain